MKHYDQSSTRKYPPISYIKKIICKGGKKTSKIDKNMYSKVQFTGKQDRKSSMNLYCA